MALIKKLIGKSLRSRIGVRTVEFFRQCAQESTAQSKKNFKSSSLYGTKEKNASPTREKLAELLNVKENTKQPLNIKTAWTRQLEFGTIEKLTFESEQNVEVPAYLCVPKGSPPFDFLICLQGHSSGMHFSIGLEKDEKTTSADCRNFALACLKLGIGALCVEQKGLGERVQVVFPPAQFSCHVLALHALTVGRTLLGDRVFEVDRAIDVLEELQEVKSVGVLGQSGGGTTALYAAALLSRVEHAIVSCCFSSFEESILAVPHCPDNYIPNLCKEFEMQDIVGLCGSKPLLMFAGINDSIFPITGARKEFAELQKKYPQNNAQLIVHVGGHEFDAKSWSEIEKQVRKIGRKVFK